MYILCTNSKMVSVSFRELRQCTRHWQRKRFYISNLKFKYFDTVTELSTATWFYFNIPRWNNMTAYFTFLHPRDFQYRYLRYFFPRRWMRLRVWHIWQRCWMRTALRKTILYSSCICHLLWWSWNLSIDSRFWRLHTNYSYLGTTRSWLLFLLNQQLGILKMWTSHLWGMVKMLGCGMWHIIVLLYLTIFNW